jgi:hypothetical protein
VVAAEPAPQGEPPSSPASTASGTIPDRAVIVLHFAECRSSRPAYRLSIAADGAVIFEGARNVTSLGRHEARAEATAVSELLARIRRSGLSSLPARSFTCDPKRRPCSMHPCSASLRVVLDGEPTEVTWTSDAPPETPLALHEIVTDVERTVDAARWVSPGP